jgi:hypothetical protein
MNDCALLVNEIEAIAREEAILGDCSVYEWCEAARARLVSRGISPRADAAWTPLLWNAARATLDKLVSCGVVTFTKGGPAGLYSAKSSKEFSL